MRKKVFIWAVLLLLFLAVVVVSGGLSFFLKVTGMATASNQSGFVNITVIDLNFVYIYSPEETIYNFNKTDPYIIPLNVSADFPVEPIGGWVYSIYDDRHGRYVYRDIIFTPNSTITAVRWNNTLIVSALHEEGGWYSANVSFYVNVSNSAPLIGYVNDTVWVCEGEALAYEFNATDVDEDELIGSMSPSDPFYLIDLGQSLNYTYYEIISGVLGKYDLGVHTQQISVVDPYSLSDTKFVDIDVIEINNPPVFLNPLGARTVWLTGEDSTFSYLLRAEDSEDGENEDGHFNFTLTWAGGENLFDIDSTSGDMFYSPSLGHEGNVYSLTTCVEDRGLTSPHENISICFPDSGDSFKVCDNFTLTVTDENRAPEIVNYSPYNNDTFSAEGTRDIHFNVTVYDPDWTIPDVDWYVDGNLREHNENKAFDNFTHRFSCDVSGVHRVEIVTTDGLLNDSHAWDIDVILKPCPAWSIEEPGVSSGGGASPSSDYCIENWVCDEWDTCQNVERTYLAGLFSIEDYSIAKAECSQNQEEDERYCGFQIKTCVDLNNCSRDDPILPRPDEKRFCYFTENPSCSDGITNCHDGACELLVDCGGPCDPCPSCSDGKQNQGEAGIDCGGPCPYACEPEVPFAFLSSLLIALAILLLLVILFVLWRLWLLWKRRHDEEEDEEERYGRYYNHY
jgi:hypothetical protein